MIVRFHRRKDQHVPKYIRNWMQDTTKNLPKRSTAPTSIGDHLIKNPDCARMYSDECFTFLARARNDYHLSILESLFIKTKKPSLCKQKEYVYKTIIFKMLL